MALTPEQFSSLKMRLSGGAIQPVASSTGAGNMASPSRGGFFERVGEDFNTRVKAQEAALGRSIDNEQGLASGLLQAAGQGAAFLGDIGTEALSSIDETVTGGAVGDFLGERVQEIATAPAVQNVAADYGKWKLENPEAAANLEATINIASILPIAGGAGVVGKKAVDTGVDVAVATGKKVAPAVATVANTTRGVADTFAMAGEGAARIPARIATNVAEKQATRQAVRQLPTKVAQQAANDGVDIIDIQDIYSLPKSQKAPIRQLAQTVKEYASGVGKLAPEEVVGRPIVARIKELTSQQGSVGQKLGEVAKELGTVSAREAGTPVFTALKKVPGLEGLKIDRTGRLDFSDTRLQTASTKSDRTAIQKIFTDAIKPATGRQKHLLRQELFEVLEGKKRSLTNLTGTQERAYQAIRQGLSDVLDAKNPQYKSLNQEFARVAKPLEDIKKFLRNTDGLDEDLLSQKAGTLARRLTSNAASRTDLKQILRNLDAATEVPGKTQISLESLQDAYNILGKYYDVAAKTGLRGQVRSGIEDATGVRDALMKAVGDVAGKTDAVRQAAFEKALREALEDSVQKAKVGGPITRALERDTTLSNADKVVQDAAIAKYEKNPKAMLDAYLKANGNVVNTDEARKLFSDVGYNGNNSAAVHTASKAISDAAFDDLLSKAKPGQDGFFMAGGSGAGKSTATRALGDKLSQAAFVFDGNLSSYDSAIKKIKAAKAKGVNVTIPYVYRDPIKAWNEGVIARMIGNGPDKGRVVPLKNFLENTEGSLDVVKKLTKEGAVDDTYAWNNSYGPGQSKQLSLEELDKIRIPKDTKARLVASTKQLLKEGRITQVQLDALLKGI